MSARASAYAKALIACPNGELISRGEKLVLIVLADSHQDKAKRFTYPSIESIAPEAMCDRRTCQRYLAGLERKGVIRRLRPANQGRGMQVFYFFTALDEIPEGWQPAALFLEQRAAEGRQKGGRRAAIGQLALVERAQEQEPKPEQEQKPPLPPSAAADGGDAGIEKPVSSDREIDEATQRVMDAVGATARRLKRKLRMVVARRVELGEVADAVADRMIAAYQAQEKNSRLLFRVAPVLEFYETGLWLHMNRWNWDQQAVREERLRSEASAGSHFG